MGTQEVRGPSSNPPRASRDAAPRQPIARIGGEKQIDTGAARTAVQPPSSTERQKATVVFSGGRRTGELKATDDTGKVLDRMQIPVLDGPVNSAPAADGQEITEEAPVTEASVDEGPIQKKFMPSDPAEGIVPKAGQQMRVVSEFSNRAKMIEDLPQ